MTAIAMWPVFFAQQQRTRAAFSFSGSAGFPSSSVYRFTTRSANAMFYFTLAKFMQVRLPMRVFLQIFSDVLRKQNVSGIAAIHDPLRDIDAGASYIRFSVASMTPLTGPLCMPIRS